MEFEKRLKNSREALVPSTRKFCLKKDFFPSMYSLACRLHVSSKKGHRTHLLPKTLSRVEFFEDAVLLYSCGWMETDVLENDYVTVMDTSKCACSHQSWYRYQSLSRFLLDGQKLFKNATC